jgi:phospholipase/lecithinase/hemolysin
MTVSRRGLILLFALLYLSPGLYACAQAYTSVVIFGDSLCDTGNDATLSAALYTVNAQVPGPATGYTNGRFTDGTDTVPAAHNYNGVWIEQLAALLPAKPVIKNSLAGGTNYSYGFATTDVGTTVFTYGPGNALAFTVNNMGQQVTDYLATNPTITNKTLFVVWGGANDLIAATSSSDITNAAARDAAIVQRLINAGATDFIVPNLPPLGLVPRFNGSASTAAPVTAAASGFDQALAAQLAAIPAANPTKTLHIYQLDTYTLFNTIVGPPIYKGLVNVTASAQGNSTINPDTYLFWDDLHPTTYGHSIIANTALTLLGTPVTTTTTLTSSNASPNPGGSVTFTASVVSSTGTPMGTVTFSDGTTILGSAVVTGSTTTATASATATFPTASTHTITAAFAGANGYSNSASTALTETVSPPTLTIVPASTSLSVATGSTITDSITATSLGGYSGTVTFACGTVPSHVSCTFSPASLSVSGSTPSASTTLTIATNATNATANLVLPARPGEHTSAPIVLAFTLFPFAGLLAFAKVRRRLPRSMTLLLLLGMISGAAALTGCSGSSAPTTTAAGTYTIPLITTSNGTSTTTNITVVVH